MTPLFPNRSFAVILIALWFLIYGVLAITNLTFVAAPIVLGFVALGIFICLLFGK